MTTIANDAGKSTELSLSQNKSKRLSVIILIFSIAFLIFFMGPPFMGQSFAPYPLIKVADVFDLLTPLVLIPLYWLIFRVVKDDNIGITENLVFLVFAAIWVLGQGMHLAANSIGHMVENIQAADVKDLTYFYDEVLSHYVWHLGVMALSAILIYRQWKNPFATGKTMWGTIIAAGILYGFTYFALVIEGVTWPIGLPFNILALGFILIWGRNKLKQQPVLLFFAIAFMISFILFAGWGIYWQGLPEFSDPRVGIL